MTPTQTRTAKSALVVVAKGAFMDHETAPDPDRVREVVVDHLEETGRNPAYALRAVRGQTVELQEESPPADPDDGYGVVVVVGQTPATDYN